MPNRAVSLLSSRLSDALRPLAAALLYYCSAWISLNNSLGLDETLIIWPASGVLLAALMLTQRRQWAMILSACGTASFIALLQSGAGLITATGFTAANVVEALIAMTLLRERPRNYSDFSDPYLVGRLFLAIVLAGLISASLGAMVSGMPSEAFFISWSTTTIFGMLIVTPMLLTLAYYATVGRSSITRKSLAKGLLVLSFVTAVTVGVFAQSTYPLLFLPFAAMLLATYFFGPPGAAASVCIILTAGLIAAEQGTGPIQLIDGSAQTKVLFFQFYLAIGVLSSFPLAASLSHRMITLADLGHSNSLLEMAERAAHVGHWRLDLVTNALACSAEIHRIHGVSQSTLARVDLATEAYHPDDRDMVICSLNDSIKTGQPFQYEARLVRPSGEVRNVFSSGEVEIDPITGKSRALYGMLMDVTERVNSLKQLEDARQRAESDAEQKAILADTDQLTGIANRRKILSTLRQEIARAEAYGSDLTIAVLDIDHFKSINDAYGHAVGDDVLTAFASAVADALRGGDALGRVGGEEFVIILPGTDEKTAVPVLERLRESIANLEWPDLALDRVTASIGLARHKSGQDERALMKAADRALYQAKGDGRNVLRIAA